MALQDIKSMQLGAVIDYCIAFNERNSQNEEDPHTSQRSRTQKAKSQKKYRKATQAEIEAYFG